MVCSGFERLAGTAAASPQLEAVLVCTCRRAGDGSTFRASSLLRDGGARPPLP